MTRFDVLIICKETNTVDGIAALRVSEEASRVICADIAKGIRPEFKAITVEEGRFFKGDRIPVETGIQ